MDQASETRRWRGLVLLCTAFFLVIMDVAIVGVAAPSIQADLGFSQQSLQWIVTAYALTFGGLLLLAGRFADLLGRRRLFVTGGAIFAVASLFCGLAWEQEILIGARALQGLGAAIIVPAALAIISTSFPEGAERNKALGVWGATAAVGGTAGLVLGGVLTDTVGWEWMFFLNLPIAAAVLAVAPRLLDESRAEGLTRSFDALGALLVTTAAGSLVYAVVEAPDAGWNSFQTLGLLALSAVLLAGFAVVESRAAAPLAPLRAFRSRALVGGNIVAAMAAGGIFGWFFVATLFLQRVLGYSPLEAGLAFLPIAIGGFIGSLASQALATKLGLRNALLIGVALIVPGLLLSRGVEVGSGYVEDLLLAFSLIGVGTPFGFVISLIAGLAGVEEREAGLASGLVNTSQQIGNALGVAVLSTVAVSKTDDVLATSDGSAGASLAALTEGTQAAFTAGLAFPAIAGLAAILLLGKLKAPAATPSAPSAGEPTAAG